MILILLSACAKWCWPANFVVKICLSIVRGEFYQTLSGIVYTLSCTSNVCGILVWVLFMIILSACVNGLAGVFVTEIALIIQIIKVMGLRVTTTVACFRACALSESIVYTCKGIHVVYWRASSLQREACLCRFNILGGILCKRVLTC